MELFIEDLDTAKQFADRAKRWLKEIKAQHRFKHLI
jgi:hypothetical protein